MPDLDLPDDLPPLPMGSDDDASDEEVDFLDPAVMGSGSGKKRGNALLELPEDQMKHLADVESSFRVDTHGGMDARGAFEDYDEGVEEDEVMEEVMIPLPGDEEEGEYVEEPTDPDTEDDGESREPELPAQREYKPSSSDEGQGLSSENSENEQHISVHPPSSPSELAQQRVVSRAASNHSIASRSNGSGPRRRIQGRPSQEVVGLGIERSTSRASRTSGAGSRGSGPKKRDPLSNKPDLQPSPAELDRDSSPEGRPGTGSRGTSYSKKQGRPTKFLRHSQRSSVASVDGDMMDGQSDEGDPRAPISRTASLGSIASGITGLSVYDKTAAAAQPGLSRLDEESRSRQSSTEPDTEPEQERADSPATPRDRAPPQQPTDTVVAQRVGSVNVPATVQREFLRHTRGNPSPSKKQLAVAAQAGLATPAVVAKGREMTLKEQTASIDRLQKENWDLKLKVFFMDEKLKGISDESIKQTIDDYTKMGIAYQMKVKEEKGLKKRIKELERALEEAGEREGERVEEVLEWQERVEQYEREITEYKRREEEHQRKEAEREERLKEYRRMEQEGLQQGQEMVLPAPPKLPSLTPANKTPGTPPRTPRHLLPRPSRNRRRKPPPYS